MQNCCQEGSVVGQRGHYFSRTRKPSDDRDGSTGQGKRGAVSRVRGAGGRNFRKKRGIPPEGDTRGALLARYEGGAQHHYRAASRPGIEGGASSRRRRTRARTGAE